MAFIIILGWATVALGLFMMRFYEKMKASKGHAIAFLIFGAAILVASFALGIATPMLLIVMMLPVLLIAAIIALILLFKSRNKRCYDFHSKCMNMGINIDSLSQKQTQEFLIIAKNYGFKDEKSAFAAYKKGCRILLADGDKIIKNLDKKEAEKQKKIDRAKEEQYKEEYNRYSVEKKLTECRGKEKYLRVLQSKLNITKKAVSALEHKKIKSPYISTKGEDWAIAGGIADAIAGPAAGVAVALDVQRRNAEHKKNAEEWNRLVAGSGITKESLEIDRDIKVMDLEIKADEYQRKIDQINNCLIDDSDQCGKRNLLTFNISGKLTEVGLLEIDVVPKQVGKVKILNSPAVLDGSVKILVQDDSGKTVGEAYYNAPEFDEDTMEVTGFYEAKKRQVIAVPLKEKCFNSDKNLSYKVEPVYLWIIEKC